MGAQGTADRPADFQAGMPAPPESEIAQIGRALHASREVDVTPEGKLAPAQTRLGQSARALHWFAFRRRRKRTAVVPRYRVHVPIDQLRSIERHVRLQSAGLETGGPLIGLRRSPTEFVVALANGPGPNATFGPANFTDDPDHVQAALDPHLASGRSLIGAWHLHPNGPEVPSMGDEDTMREEVATAGAHPFFVQIIVTKDAKGIQCRAFVFEHGRLFQAELVRRTASDHFSRLAGVANVGKLQPQTILFAGVGSGGSMMAVTAAQAGVGGFLLMDDGTLEDCNTVRHEADLRYVGMNKAEAVADLIRHRNPEARIVALAERLGPDEERALALMGLVDLVICAADDESSRRAISRLARQAGKPLLIPGAYAGAVGGDVIFVDGTNGPCYVCSLTKIVGETVSPEDIHKETKADYGSAAAGLPPQAGLGADIQMIATLAAKWAIRILDPSPAEDHWVGLNYLVWGNRNMVDLRALTVVEWGRIDPDPACEACGSQADLTARTGKSPADIGDEVSRLIDAAKSFGSGPAVDAVRSRPAPTRRV